MTFKPVTLVKTETVCEDIALLHFKERFEIQAGEFVFLWIPGVGEKPFSILLDDPLTLVAIDVGQFTHEIQALPPGTETYIRGPHGQPVHIEPGQIPILVAGGTGLAAVYQIARDFDDAVIFVGARTKERLYFLEECRREWRKSMWQPTMAAKVIPGGSPSALRPTWLTHQRTGFKPCDSITAARNPWCMPR